MREELHYKGQIEFTVGMQGADRALGRMHVSDGVRNLFGTLHAGALLWLAGVTATVLAMGKPDADASERGFPLAINLNASLVGNVRAADVLAEPQFVKRGRRVTVVQTKVNGADGKLLVEMTTTHVPAG